MRLHFVHIETPADMHSLYTGICDYTHMSAYTSYTHVQSYKPIIIPIIIHVRECVSPYTSCTHVQSYKCSEATENKDEEDFDQFLESVKARQLSLTAKGELTLTLLSTTHRA